MEQCLSIVHACGELVTLILRIEVSFHTTSPHNMSQRFTVVSYVCVILQQAMC